jgi:IS5 family transposase
MMAVRDSEMHQTKKGNQYHFGMKAYIGVDTESGLVQILVTTAANFHDVTQARYLLHDEETDVSADPGYRGVEKREEEKDLQVNWHIAMMPAERRALNLETTSGQRRNAAERVKAGKLGQRLSIRLESSCVVSVLLGFDTVDWPKTPRDCRRCLR